MRLADNLRVRLRSLLRRRTVRVGSAWSLPYGLKPIF